MKKKKHVKHDEVSFWESSSDLMTALLMILMLIILLLILYLMRMPDREYIDYFDNVESVDSDVESEESGVESVESEVEHEEQQNNGNGAGNGGGDGDGDEPDEEPGEYPEGDEGTKSAVYVMLVDGETKRTIPEAGVMFDLHAETGKLQILNTYYPEKITYRDFATTEKGTFYLPEKIPQGLYYFRNFTEATGYDLAKDTHFDVDKLYDWPEPLVVTVPVYPARNVIRIQMKDAKSEETVSGGAFDVIAAADIVTLDGTVRFEKGEVVGEIVCDENGYGESEELYLGTYLVKESEIPEYYAKVTKSINVEVEKKGTEEVVEDIDNEKTRIEVTLVDELTGAPIPSASFTVSSGTSNETYETNAQGAFVLENLDKDTTYGILQTSTAEDYILPKETTSVTVNVNGRIGGESEKSVEITNRMLRVQIQAQDAVLGGQLSDLSLALYDSTDTVVKSWASTGAPVTLTNLKPGGYYIVVNGKESRQFPIRVDDVKEIQTQSVRVWTVKSYLAIAGGILVAVGVIFLLVKLMQKLLKRKKK